MNHLELAIILNRIRVIVSTVSLSDKTRILLHRNVENLTKNNFLKKKNKDSIEMGKFLKGEVIISGKAVL